MRAPGEVDDAPLDVEDVIQVGAFIGFEATAVQHVQPCVVYDSLKDTPHRPLTCRQQTSCNSATNSGPWSAGYGFRQRGRVVGAMLFMRMPCKCSMSQLQQYCLTHITLSHHCSATQTSNTSIMLCPVPAGEGQAAAGVGLMEEADSCAAALLGREAAG